VSGTSSNTQTAVGRLWECAARLAGAGVDPFVVERCLNRLMGGVMSIYTPVDYEEQRVSVAKTLEKRVKEICHESD
jgi:hypothetical protein